jgi:hypothetical protein
MVRHLPPKSQARLKKARVEGEPQIDRINSMTNSNSECLSAIYSGGEESDGGNKRGGGKNAGRDKRSVKFEHEGGAGDEADFSAV